MWWFTADEHYGHANIIRYCDRPFTDVEEMNATLIANHNQLVRKEDTVVHAGDFTLNKKQYAEGIIKQLKGQHIFLLGSHDRWLPDSTKQIWVKSFGNQKIVVCHYAMRSWPHSHHGSWQLHGHSHGKLATIPNQMDVGVDCHDYCPVIMDTVMYTLDPEVTDNE